MSFAKTHSAQTHGITGHIVDVEVDLSKGLHLFSIVGLPDKAVEESRDRVSAAIKHSGYDSPKSKNQKVVISLAPADLKKEGPIFDVAIALAYLLASESTRFKSESRLFLGELSLDGKIRSVRGVLPIAQEAKRRGFTELYVPEENALEAALVAGISVFKVQTLRQLIDHLEGKSEQKLTPEPQTIPQQTKKQNSHLVDFDEVKGQENAKRGLEIAAAGGHNIALYGPAGTGKTMLARAFAGILPPLSFEEMIEVTGIYSVAGTLTEPIVTEAPFRAPHHTSSYVSIVGGGVIPKPGEITLAHRGVLFADEFPEFDRRVLESLRQPLEDKIVMISRSKGAGVFPANFILIAAMNPCPCGNEGSTKRCVCTPKDILRYKKKVSGPIADRIDLWIEVPLISHKMLGENKNRGEKSAIIRERISNARNRQQTRYQEHPRAILKNSDLSSKDVDVYVPLEEKVRDLLNQSAERMQFSGRAYFKTLKVARTIADLEGSPEVKEKHLLEALQYRQKPYMATS